MDRGRDVPDKKLGERAPKRDLEGPLAPSEFDRELPVDPSLLASPLLARGGYAIFEDVFTRIALAALKLEARAQYWSGQEQITTVESSHSGRGIRPTRKLVYSGGGEVQNELYGAPALTRFLESVTELPVQPTGSEGGYLYYTRQGDHLGLHLDVEHCDLVVLTLIQDHSKHDSPSGSCVVFPGFVGVPLPTVRATALAGGGVRLKLRPGQSLVMFGGLVPHLVLPVDEQQARITSALCFRAGELSG